MILAICIDDRNGISFNKRRQSRDGALIKNLAELAGDKKILIGSYSQPLFTEGKAAVDDSFIENAADDDICFAENTDPAAFADRINGIILYRWNRHYPSDKKFTLDLSEFELVSSEEFAGSSHDKITREIYRR